MKDNVRVKIVAVKKGTPEKDVEKLLQALSETWKETNPDEVLCCIPIEVDDVQGIIPKGFS